MEGSRQALSRAGGGIWGCQSPSSILPPLQHCARTRTKRSGKANQLLLVPGTLSHSMGRAVSHSSPARRNGMCWKIWSTQETCKIKPQTIGSYQYLSKQKMRRKNQKKINPVTFKNAISGIPSATFDGIHTHMVLFVKNHE